MSHISFTILKFRVGRVFKNDFRTPLFQLTVVMRGLLGHWNDVEGGGGGGGGGRGGGGQCPSSDKSVGAFAPMAPMLLHHYV